MISSKVLRKNSIALIICYLGELPWYIHYFLHSCVFNPSINFFLVTDDLKSRLTIPDNVTVVYKDLSQINVLVSRKVGLDIDIKFAYKLCDFKPAYGKIFEDYIKDYEFWGYGDLDIIFGDIRAFMTNDVLQNHDVISVRHDFLTGYFQLFKNNGFTKSLYERSKDYKKVFTSDKHYCFDETNFTHKQFTDGLPADRIDCEIDSMMHVVRRLEKEGKIKAYFDFHVVEGLPGKLKWEKGKLYYKNKYEIMLYHLIMFKLEGKSKIDIKKHKERFRISTTTIY